MRLADLVDAARLADPADGAREVAGLTADSRDVKPGFVFAALPGTRTDGARFIPDALARGAVAVIARPEARHMVPPGMAFLADDEPRRLLALMAARFHPRQPDTLVAVTGTNGKTSVAAFARQIWAAQGLESASLGTIGIVTGRGAAPLGLTTPDPVALHGALDALSREGVTHAALEASSHGLAQHRLDGLRLAAAGFTNITRDHLDYHPSFEDYFAAKLRLFIELLPPGAPAVVNADAEHGASVAEAARGAGRAVLTVGARGEALRLLAHFDEGFAQRLRVAHAGGETELRLPLVGDFQASNALVAAGLCIAAGLAPEPALRALESLRGARGRLDLAGTTAAGAPVFVDYAHTPDALANALRALRPYARGRLVVVFGAGGDRDRGKRPLMGAAAAEHADTVIVTDDNPRSEDAAAIRRGILAGAPGAREIGDREQAIRTAVRELRANDVLLIAGKGHETGQIVGSRILPFSDHDAVAAALEDAIHA